MSAYLRDSASMTEWGTLAAPLGCTPRPLPQPGRSRFRTQTKLKYIHVWTNFDIKSDEYPEIINAKQWMRGTSLDDEAP